MQTKYSIRVFVQAVPENEFWQIMLKKCVYVKSHLGQINYFNRADHSAELYIVSS